jgi:hypothetical protein
LPTPTCEVLNEGIIDRIFLPCTALAKDKLSQFFNICTPVNFLSAQ